MKKSGSLGFLCTIGLRDQIPDTLPPAFQDVANIQFRQGLFILETNLFIWIR